MKMNRSFRIGWLIALLACAPGARAQAPQPLTLRQAVELALKQNPALRATREQVNVSRAQVGEARAGWLPRLDVSQGFTRGDNPVYVFGTLLTQRQFKAGNFNLSALNQPSPLDNFQTRVDGQVSLFDSGRTYWREAGAKKMSTAADYETAQARQDLILRVVRAYYGVIVAREELGAANQALDSAKANEQQVKAMTTSGLVVTSDLLSAEVFRSQMRDRQITASNALEVARLNLGRELGMPPGASPQVAGTLGQPKSLAGKIDQWEKTALSERPALRAAQLQEQAANTGRKLAKADFGPQIGLFADFERDAETLGGPSGTNWAAGARLDWNVFDGGAKRSRLAEADARRSQAEDQLEWLRSGIELEVRQAYLDAQAAAERAGAAQAAVSQAGESLRIIQNRYQAGLVTITELLRAQTAQLDARTGYLSALHDWQVARAQLERAAGQLTLGSNFFDQGGTP
ncbi:MAG TPA: TolC family protein [Candidatus Dormibacteraeota bacterium]|nr:TolC family protein [Candidatus Dormibacteraeota bacterium]